MKLMTRLALSIAIVAGCGDGDHGPDGPPQQIDAQQIDGTQGPDAFADACIMNGGAACFQLPSAVLVGHEGTQFQTPDNSCTRNPQTTATAITISGITVDETATGVTAVLGVFYTPGFSGTPDTTVTSDGGGLFSVGLPTPAQNSFDVRVTRASAYETRYVDTQIFFNPTTVTGLVYPSISRAAWSAGLQPIGEPVRATEGAMFATTTDCDARLLEFAAVTMSSTSSRGTNAAPTFIAGTRVYYLEGTPVPHPVGRDTRTESSLNGGFVVLGLQPGTAFVQSWGFANAADLALGLPGLKLVGEKQITIVADVLTSTQLTPRSGP